MRDRSFWSIVETLKSAGLNTLPYHVYVPSFGEWGFVLATHGAYTPPTTLPDGLRFLTPAAVAQAFDFPRDMAPVAVAREPSERPDARAVLRREFDKINR